MPTRTHGKVGGAKSSVGALAALLGGFGLQQALAQDSEAVTVDVARCAGLSADARLACFGEQVERALTEDDERTAVTEEVVAERAARSNDEHPTKRASSADLRPQEAAEDARGDEYTGVIVAIRERLPNAYVITLDNGQIWQQTEPKPYPLRPGLEVRIYPTRWGHRYRLNGLGTGDHIQVQKLQ
jgi:hypothetical protein